MDELKKLETDEDGMMTYEYIVNHFTDCLPQMDFLISNLRKVDISGQFLASSARFLFSVDAETFGPFIGPLIEGAIEKDRQRKYIGSLLEAIWGKDYEVRAERLQAEDDNFRRIYKRIYPAKSRNLALENS